MPNLMPCSESREIEIDTTVCAVDSPGLQLKHAKELQHQDPSLEDIINYLEKGNVPTDSISARRLMATVEDYVLEEGLEINKPPGRLNREFTVCMLMIPVLVISLTIRLS